MDKDIRVWLYDILTAIEEIESFFDGGAKRFADYLGDLKTKRAVERNLGIIGEAMNRIVKQDVDVEISSVRNIVDLRNRVVHGYDSVSDEMIWGIVVNHLPVLKSEVQALLDSK